MLKMILPPHLEEMERQIADALRVRPDGSSCSREMLFIAILSLAAVDPRVMKAIRAAIDDCAKRPPGRPKEKGARYHAELLLYVERFKREHGEDATAAEAARALAEIEIDHETQRKRNKHSRDQRKRMIELRARQIQNDISRATPRDPDLHEIFLEFLELLDRGVDHREAFETLRKKAIERSHRNSEKKGAFLIERCRQHSARQIKETHGA